MNLGQYYQQDKEKHDQFIREILRTFYRMFPSVYEQRKLEDEEKRRREVA